MTGSLDLRLNQILETKSQNQILFNKVISNASETSEVQPLTNEEKDDLFDEFNSSFFRDVDVRPKKMYDASLKSYFTRKYTVPMIGRHLV